MSPGHRHFHRHWNPAAAATALAAASTALYNPSTLVAVPSGAGNEAVVQYTTVTTEVAAYPSAPSAAASSAALSSLAESGAPSYAASAPASSGTAVSGGGSSAYKLSKTYDSSNFFDEFTFQTGFDKWTNGFAVYQSSSDAQSAGLASTNNNVIHLAADSKSAVSNWDSGNTGRNSVRVESNDVFNTGILIADFKHIPASACGIWPAYWLLNDNADYSEIDIIEAANMDQNTTISAYTTTEPCTLQEDTCSSKWVRTECAASLEKIQNDGRGGFGCGASAAPGTFGDAFNAAGGGVWALQLESDAFKIWVWQRKDVPSDIGSGSPDPSTWGTPTMNFAPGSCAVTKAFKNMKIIINLTFCGADAGNGGGWAGYGGVPGCSATTGVAQCNQYVAETPSAFNGTYFDINSMKIYTQ